MESTDSINENEGFYFLELSDELSTVGINYYEEYSKLYVSNMLMRKKVEELRSERNQLKDQLESKMLLVTKEKRSRRKAKEIVRHYECSHCGKTYGSEASLRHHIKVKHSD